jgi:hypothetical protein
MIKYNLTSSQIDSAICKHKLVESQDIKKKIDCIENYKNELNTRLVQINRLEKSFLSGFND